MNKILLFIFTLSIAGLVSCEKDDDPIARDHTQSPVYKIQILSPNDDPKHLMSTIKIHVIAETSGEKVISNANIRLYKKLDTNVVYSKPNHVRAYTTDGIYEFSDKFILSPTNGIEENVDYVVEARVWGKDMETNLIRSTVVFRVHP